MHPDDHLAVIRREGAALAATLGHDLDLTVDAPSCPGWTLGDLALHCGQVHRWATAVVRAKTPDEPLAFYAPRPEVVDHQWFEEGVAELAAALEEAGPEAPAWNFMGVQPRQARFWFRRQAHETSVHRWDAELARTGGASPVEVELAVDGIDELLDVILPRMLRRREADLPEGGLGGLVHLHAADSPHGEWLVRIDGTELAVGHGHENADTVVSGTASDLLLWLWGRLPAEKLAVSGDAAIVGRWAEVLPAP